jgi:hypothetical protein
MILTDKKIVKAIIKKIPDGVHITPLPGRCMVSSHLIKDHYNRIQQVCRKYELKNLPENDTGWVASDLKISLFLYQYG